ncbi:conjugal transfer protein TraI [Aureimonas altamirensis]|uniref:Conjugal transfer protein TraI n=1 Tax=Aureimonas altamirensis TaxID=370622 RepID=A0A0B1Q4X2_9HYPH|nr:TrbI/VirB10 family protein [Aureimonas altamirensis]KHJ53880.1 conjugal transfer protein TraI [Aureimonas altamirensis]
MTDAPDLKAELRLRPGPPRVTRLSRKVLIGAGGVAGVAVAAALFWALDTNRHGGQSATELHNVDNTTPADGLQSLPRDYTSLPRPEVPELGPALPGDLGRPIRRAQERGQPVTPPTIETPRADPEEQRRLAEIEAARLAGLFTDSRGAQTSGHAASIGGGSGSSAANLAASFTPPAETPPLDAGSAQNMQDRKFAFVNATPDKRTVSTDRVQDKASPYVVQAGTVIAAALITGIRSDLPGQITAQVTEHVYDSPTGAHLLIPQGSRLIGQYDSQVAFGQRRVLLVWSRIVMPDGTSIVLERLQGTDPQGFSGLEDEVDHHWGQLFRAAALSTLLGVGTQLAIDDESEIARAIRESAQDSASDIGQQIVGRQLNIQPTLTVRPGFPVRVIVQRDLVMQVYGAATETR